MARMTLDLRSTPQWTYEARYLQDAEAGRPYLIGGGDEVGRGCLAGPVVAAIVILDPLNLHGEINDSKRLTPVKRKELSLWIRANAIDYGIGVATSGEVDSLGIVGATKRAFCRAYEGLRVKPRVLLLDAMQVEGIRVRQHAIIRGDNESFSIGAASIVAKVYRDRFMERCHRIWPDYGFDSNKGYGVAKHLQGLRLKGTCPLHRHTFAPLRDLTLMEAKA